MQTQLFMFGLLATMLNALRLPVKLQYDYQEMVNIELSNKLQYTEVQPFFLPESMILRFQFAGETIVITLEKSWDIYLNRPIFVSRHGAVETEFLPLSLEHAVYENAGFKACILVSVHNQDHANPIYTVFGTFMGSDFREYAIQPADNFTDSNPLHQVIQPNWGRTNTGGFTFSLNQIPKTMPLKESERKKRDSASEPEESLIELLFVVDFSIYKIWYEKSEGGTPEERDVATKTSLRQFYAYVIAGINMRYKRIPKENKIKLGVKLVGLYIADSPSASKWVEHMDELQLDAERNLRNFRKWSASTEGLPLHDHAIAFTAYDLADEDSELTSGISYLGSMCSTSSHSLVEDHFNFKVSWTATHEIAHSLGADHDGASNRCLKDIGYIMDTTVDAQSLSSRKNNWKFSSCSLRAFIAEIELLNSFGVNCLSTTDDSVYDIKNKLKAAGYETRSYDAYVATEEVDQMCIDAVGQGSSVCREWLNNKYNKICERLFCLDTYYDMQQWQEDEMKCTAVAMKEGISCGKNKVCSTDKVCVYNDSAPDVPVDCPFGDMPGKLYYVTTMDLVEHFLTCDIIVKNYTFMCYYSFIEKRCCASCAAVNTGIEGCEYGDATSCSIDQCDKYWPATDLTTCCATCTVDSSVTVPTTTHRPGCYGDTPNAIFEPTGLSCEEGVAFMPSGCYDQVEFDKCCQSCEKYASDIELKVRGLQDCSFGDHDSLCWPNDCPTYDEEKKKSCCYSCSEHQSIIEKAAEFAENCDDTSGPITKFGGFQCSQMNQYINHYCYSHGLSELCCQTCSSYGLPNVNDCPFGNRKGRCVPSQCQEEIANKKNLCCKTCAPYTTSTPIPTFPATTPTTTVVPSTFIIIEEDSAEGLCFKNIRDLLFIVILSLMACLSLN